MQARLLAAAGAMALMGAQEARAEDWRVVLPYHGGDVHLVDADSVVRRADGRISFKGQVRADPLDADRQESWDRYDIVVSGRCGPAGANGDYQGRLDLSYYRDGQRTAPPPVEAEADGGAAAPADEAEYREGQFIADSVCLGKVGYRGFASPEAVTAALAAGRSDEWVSGYETDERELAGTVLQGFEMSGIALCESEADCSSGISGEFCWLEGPISVPGPPGAPDWVNGGPRRDRADLAFRGRIVRSFVGRGFGHMEAFGCLVRATGPGRPATLPQDGKGRAFGAEGRTPAAAAAHAAVAAAIGEAAASAGLTLAAAGRTWTFDALQADGVDPGGRGACASHPRAGGAGPGGQAPSIYWSDVVEIAREGAAVTVSMKQGDEQLQWHMGTPEAAAGLKGLHARVRGGRASGIEQRGRQVTFVLAGGGRESVSYPDAARAVEAAAIAEALRARDVVASAVSGNRYQGYVRRPVTVIFPEQAQAQAAEARMRALQEVCTGG